jgi:hypothetical protein
MIIHSVHSLTNNKQAVNLLTSALEQITDNTIIKNYHPDYSNVPGNLFYILEEGRYREDFGKYSVIEEDGEFICSAGWNEYELDTNVALMITRAYVNPKHRTKYYMGHYILPAAIEETSKYDKRWITCNDYNDSIYQWFVRSASGKTSGLFNNWPAIYKKFKPIGKKEVYYTEQYVAEYKDDV